MRPKLKTFTVHYFKTFWNKARTETIREEVRSRKIRALDADDAQRRFERGQKHGDLFTQFIDVAADDNFEYV